MKYTAPTLKTVSPLMLFVFGMGTCLAQGYYNSPPQPQGYYPPQQQGYYPQQGGIGVPGPPPPLQQEVIVTAPSINHVWTPGYWTWQNRWVWMPGQWVLPPHPGARWVEPRWEHHEREEEGFRMRHGEWR